MDIGNINKKKKKKSAEIKYWNKSKANEKKFVKNNSRLIDYFQDIFYFTKYEGNLYFLNI